MHRKVSEEGGRREECRHTAASATIDVNVTHFGVEFAASGSVEEKGVEGSQAGRHLTPAADTMNVVQDKSVYYLSLSF